MMELQAIIAGVIASHCKVIEARVRARWQSQSGIQGNAEIGSDFPVIMGNIVTATINAHGAKAWVSEFGRGSQMASASENPYLNEYLRGDNFNQWRLHSSRVPIMGRSEGEYKDLDGNTQYSTGKMQGLDLERDGDARFQPMLPQRIIKEEFEREYPDIILAIQSAVAGYGVAMMTMQTEVYL